MGDQVHHPPDSPIISPTPKTTPSRLPPPPAAASPRTYIVKVPKDRVYRVPPPENALKFNQIAQRKKRRCHWCFWFIGILFTLITLLAIAAGIFYLVVRPKLLQYSIASIDIRGFNTTPPSPEFNVTITANNPNHKIGFRYVRDSSISILFKDETLCNGVLPEFYQPPNNVTAVKTTLAGDAVKVRSLDETALVNAEKKGKVPLTVKVIAPLKVKVGAVETGPITLKIDCDVTVDKLAPKPNIVSMHCAYSAYFHWSFKI